MILIKGSSFQLYSPSIYFDLSSTMLYILYHSTLQGDSL